MGLSIPRVPYTFGVVRAGWGWFIRSLSLHLRWFTPFFACSDKKQTVSSTFGGLRRPGSLSPRISISEIAFISEIFPPLWFLFSWIIVLFQVRHREIFFLPFSTLDHTSVSTVFILLIYQGENLKFDGFFSTSFRLTPARSWFLSSMNNRWVLWETDGFPCPEKHCLQTLDSQFHHD